jgi:hypothetical protein
MKLLSLFSLITVAAWGQPDVATERWDGSIVLDGLKVPFTMQLGLDQNAVSGAFVNGEERTPATSGTLAGGQLRLQFQQYGTVLEAAILKSGLSGTYSGAKFGTHNVEGDKYCTCGSEGEAGPDISGAWKVAGASGAWRLQIQRKGEDTIAHLLRPEDANGALTGRFDGLAFQLHHFDGQRAALLEIEPRKDGTLALMLKEPRGGTKELRAIRE